MPNHPTLEHSQETESEREGDETERGETESLNA